MFCCLPTADPYVHLDKCTYFDQARLDQRFEVVDEIAASICSKFARSKLIKDYYVDTTGLMKNRPLVKFIGDQIVHPPPPPIQTLFK